MSVNLSHSKYDEIIFLNTNIYLFLLNSYFLFITLTENQFIYIFLIELRYFSKNSFKLIIILQFIELVQCFLTGGKFLHKEKYR